MAREHARDLERIGEIVLPDVSDLEGLVYHSRSANEHRILRDRIDAVLRKDETRLEVDMARQTMAEFEAKRLTLVANKQTLLEQLRLKYKTISPEIEQTIETCRDANKVQEWLRGFATAPDLASIGIVGK